VAADPDVLVAARSCITIQAIRSVAHADTRSAIQKWSTSIHSRSLAVDAAQEFGGRGVA
jgi:hypothetical protein